jgi:hypothetical protein
VTRRSIFWTHRIILCAVVLAAWNSNFMWAQSAGKSQPDAYSANNRPPDARLKTDILVVIAHPDDETVVSAYLAREVYDQHKTVKVVYGTHGDAGNNEVVRSKPWRWARFARSRDGRRKPHWASRMSGF